LTLQRRMLWTATPDGDGGHRDWGWTESGALDEAAFAPFAGEARALVEARRHASTDPSGGRWGWKDPRTTVLLDFWQPLLPEARYLLVYRFPWEVADSMQRLGAEVFLRHPDYAYRIWEYYNRALLDFLDRAGDRAVLISANALMAAPEEVEAVFRARLRLEVPVGFVADRLRPAAFGVSSYGGRLAELLAAARPSSLALLGELDRRAALPSPPLPRAPAASHAAVRSARLSVVIPCFDHGEFLLEAVASVDSQSVDEPLELVIVN